MVSNPVVAVSYSAAAMQYIMREEEKYDAEWGRIITTSVTIKQRPEQANEWSRAVAVHRNDPP